MSDTKAFKRKFLLWASDWFQNEPDSQEVPFVPEAIDIASLLQATGYRIRFVDRCDSKDMHVVPGVPRTQPACRVTIMCPSSGLRLELDAPTTTCNCPPVSTFEIGNSWEAGDGAESTDTSIVPKLSEEISRASSEILKQHLTLTRIFPDLNDNNLATKPEIKLEEASRESKSTVEIKKDAEECSKMLMKTPNNGMPVLIPNAPMVSTKSSETEDELVVGRQAIHRSLDTLTSPGQFIDDFPEPGKLTPKDDDDSGTREGAKSDLNTTITFDSDSSGQKAISKSSPAIHFEESTFQRSDTFVFEGNVFVETELSTRSNNDAERTSRSRTVSPNPSLPPSTESVLLNKLETIQAAVNEAILIISGQHQSNGERGEILKTSKLSSTAVQKLTRNVRPLRSLSDFWGGSNRTKDTRCIPVPKMRRPNSTTHLDSATPTTSRPSRPTLTVTSVFNKSASTTSLEIPGSGFTVKTPARSKSNSSLSPQPSTIIRNPSKLRSPTMKSSSKTTLIPPLPASTSSRPIQNLKYAHVKSSIPKATMKKKP